MPFRFFRRVRIAPGVTINLSKSGPSVSVGPRGAKVTLGHGRVRRTVGLPGTGLFYTTTTKVGSNRPAPTAPAATTPSAGFWAGRSPGGKIALVVIGLVLAYLAVSSASGPAGTEPTSSVSPALGLVGAAASPKSVAAAPTATPTAARTAKPKATPKPTPKPTLKPTLKPTAKPMTLTIKVVSLTSPVGRGSSASLSIRTSAGARCSIEVQYSSGPSSASGLGDKTASSTGTIGWTWRVGTNTALGTWPIYIDCSKGSAYNVLETRFTVVR